MFELLTIVVFVWLLIKTIGLAFKLTWGMAKIVASILLVLALPPADRVSAVCGRCDLDCPRCNDRYSSRNHEVLHKSVNTEL